MLSPFCEYLSMIHDIEQFDKELLSTDISCIGYKKPPFIYEAYNAAIKEKLLSFRMEIINIEKDITAQGISNVMYYTYNY